jgi:thiol:disulfide interchange protein DsbD
MNMIRPFRDSTRDSGPPANSSFSGRGDHKPKLYALLATLAFVVLATIAFAQGTAYPPAASVLQPQAYVSLQPVPRGQVFEIAVVSKISPGFHVNAHEPSEEYLIPTRVLVDLPPGFVLVDTTYPRGVMRAFRFSKTQLRVYESSFTVLMNLRADAGTPLGPKKLGLTVAYQACNQDACLPPTKVQVAAAFEVASADTPTHPANASIFSAAPPVKFPSQH